MKKNVVLLGSAVSVVALTVGSLSFAAASSGQVRQRDAWGLPITRSASSDSSTSDAPAISTARTITVISKGGQGSFIDVGQEGFSQGDYVVVHTPLFNRAGDRIGEFTVREDVMKTEPNLRLQAFTTARLFGRGKITAQGIDTNARIITLAVTGGTGEFRKVRGEVVITFRENSVLTVYHLVP